MKELPRLAAVITTFRPDPDLLERLAAVRSCCRVVILVDNTPGGHRFGELPSGVVVLQDGVNKGLGRALNQGVQRACSEGASEVVLFDQDSSPTRATLIGLCDALRQARGLYGSRVCVAPTHVDDALIPQPQPEPLSSCNEERHAQFFPVRCLATSGMTFELAAWRDEQRFSEDLFLDLVDFEWCWRQGEQGWRFLRISSLPMRHRLGIAQKRILGLPYHVPAPFRHYFQFRDTLRLLPRAYVPVYSKLRLGLILPPKVLFYPFLLDRGLERLLWMARGVRDALRGRSGVGAAADLLGCHTKAP